MIGESTAERIKLDIGMAMPPDEGEGRKMSVKGRDLVAGVPKEIEVSQAEIAGALAELVGQIVETVLSALEQTEPELAADIFDQGIVMTGGGALLARIDEVLAAATGLPVIVADDALICVAMGAGRALEDPVYQGVMTST
jgi:rod shape-determining protein MreB